jgi:hypothetical protein
MEILLQNLLPSIVTGLIAWGGIRAEMKYLRRDVDRAHERLDKLPAKVCHP